MQSDNEKRALRHAMNCPHRSLAPDDACTCAVNEREELSRLRAENEALRKERDELAAQLAIVLEDATGFATGKPVPSLDTVHPRSKKLLAERDELAAKCAGFSDGIYAFLKWENEREDELTSEMMEQTERLAVLANDPGTRAKALLECVELLRDRQHGEVSGKWNERVDKALAGLA